jgi:DNA-binding beta-propeller fold protein YncE
MDGGVARALFICLAAVAAIVPGGCSLGADDPGDHVACGVRLAPVPRVVVAACRSAQARVSYTFLCPARLPRPTRFGHAETPLAFTAYVGRELVDVNYATAVGRRPDAFLHFVVGRALPIAGIPRNARPARLGGRRGLLAPATSVSRYQGPYFANHVRFFWRQRGIRYVATLHAFGQAATTRLLGRIVRTLRPARELSAPDPGSAATARIGVPTGPRELLIAPPDLYVVSDSPSVGDPVTRVDMSSLDARAIRGLDRSGVHVAFSGGAIWATGSYFRGNDGDVGQPRLARIDPATGRVAGRLAIPRSRNSDPTSLVAAAGSLWVALDRSDRAGVVCRIDPRAGRPQARIRVGRSPQALAVEHDAVWVVNARDDTISRIDATTNAVTTFKVAQGPARLAAASGSLWLTHPAAGVVTRIDPSSGRTVAVIATGGSPHGITADARGVWVALPGSEAVVRIDPGANRVVDTIRLRGDPLALASDGESVWVALSSEALVVRTQDIRPDAD